MHTATIMVLLPNVTDFKQISKQKSQCMYWDCSNTYWEALHERRAVDEHRSQIPYWDDSLAHMASEWACEELPISGIWSAKELVIHWPSGSWPTAFGFLGSFSAASRSADGQNQWQAIHCYVFWNSRGAKIANKKSRARGRENKNKFYHKSLRVDRVHANSINDQICIGWTHTYSLCTLPWLLLYWIQSLYWTMGMRQEIHEIPTRTLGEHEKLRQ